MGLAYTQVRLKDVYAYNADMVSIVGIHMAMVGVDSGSLHRRTHSLSRLAWSWVGGRLTPFYIHQMNRVNSRNGSAMMTAP